MLRSVIKRPTYSTTEFAKLHAIRACVPTWSTCQRVCVPTYQKRANFSSFLPTYHKVFQCFNLVFQRVKRHANFSTWRANVPKRMQIFQTFLLPNAKVNLCTLFLCKKLSIMLDIILIYTMCKLYYTSFLYFMPY